MDRPSELDRGKNLASLVRIAPPFVGRRQELDCLVPILQEAISGHPRVVLIPGEAGIGKTRLLQEARLIAQQYAIQIGYGRCYEDLTLPYLPFVGIFRAFLEHLPPNGERTLGVTVTLHRQWGVAEPHFQAAIDVATRLVARPELGCTYLDYARMLTVRERKDDRRRAIELLRQASAIFHERDMEPFIRRAAQFAEALQAGKPLIRQPGTVSPDHLSAQEIEMLLQLTQGRTDQEIADTLVLSPQTVARHVSGLFDKIGVKSRAAAAAYGVEQGFAPPAPPHRATATSAARDRMVGASATHPLRIILVTDMASSTALIQRLGDAQAYELLERHNAIIRDCLRAHHGFEVLHTGDGVEASFLSASSAVACAVAIQQAFAQHNQEHPREPIPVRIGINAGEPIPTEGRLFGTAVHTAFRICSQAQPGQILVSDVVRQLAAGGEFTFITRGRMTLKSLQKRVCVYAVQWEEEGA